VSLHHENLVWPIEMPGLKKLVLVFMARAAHLTNRECNPSVQLIAFACGMSESAVRTFLKELIADGFLSSLKVPGKGTVYRINVGEA
jgi:hypothetical protein